MGELAASLADLMTRLLGPATDEAGAMLAEYVGNFRKRRAARVATLADDLVRESGQEIKGVPPGALIKILDESSLVDDDELVTRWAGLLASAAVTGAIHPAFPKILSELSPDDARVLDFIASRAPSDGDLSGLEHPRYHGVSAVGLLKIVPETALKLCIENLMRQGLVVEPAVDLDIRRDADIKVTKFGLQFVKACRGPAKRR